MSDASQDGERSGGVQFRYLMIAACAALVLLGLAGQGHAAIGYALFLIATLAILAGATLLAIFALTRLFETAALRRAYVSAFWLGGGTYVLAVAAFAGYYTHEAFSGRIEWRYIVFGPAALAAIVILDMGIWRVIVQRNLPTLARFGNLWRRETLDQPALRNSLIDEVVLHRTLLTVSPFRWLRHQLIFWGFGLMFMVELVAVAFREAFPSFGWVDIWHQLDHPVRLAFDLAYDLTGLMILAGCLMALAFRLRVQGKDEQKYTDTPTAVFLLIVTVTGFMAEGARLSAAGDAPWNWASFVGVAFAPISPSSTGGQNALWVVHALAACGFIAYVPLKRMIHSCATPIGRLINSQKGLLSAKKARVVRGLARGFEPR
jgi:MFS family permease